MELKVTVKPQDLKWSFCMSAHDILTPQWWEYMDWSVMELFEDIGPESEI